MSEQNPVRARAMTKYSTCIACGAALMFTPITRQWVHIGGNAGINHYATPKSEDVKEFRDWLEKAFPDPKTRAEVKANMEVPGE